MDFDRRFWLRKLCGKSKRKYLETFWARKKSRRKFPAKIQLLTCRDDAQCRNSLSICIVEYFSWCDCANRRHAIIAGFSFQEVWFSRRKFIFSGEKSVRFAATSHGGKPLAESGKNAIAEIKYFELHWVRIAKKGEIWTCLSESISDCQSLDF